MHLSCSKAYSCKVPLKNFTGIILAFLCFLKFAVSQAPSRPMTREEYVARYKNLAIEEMNIHGIPASIKLAQAILESGSGNSWLAREANNHFGIKCHEWRGESVRMDDDAPYECFRKYSSVEQSYKDHSIFLTTRPRYAFLFELDITDYRGWAHGLKKAGYATNPNYAELLIKIIEDLHLNELDVPKPPLASRFSEDTLTEETSISGESDAYPPGRGKRHIFTNNSRKYIIARKGDTFYSLAREFNIYSFQIWKYNELSRHDQLKEGEIVYLEKKRNKAEVPFHVVSKGETMRSISQFYGIRLKALYRYNRMKPGDEPKSGQVLWLQEKKPEN